MNETHNRQISTTLFSEQRQDLPFIIQNGINNKTDVMCESSRIWCEEDQFEFSLGHSPIRLPIVNVPINCVIMFSQNVILNENVEVEKL